MNNDQLKQRALETVITCVVSLVMALVAFFSLSMAKPAPAPVAVATPGGVIAPKSINFNGIICDTGETYCVDSRVGMSAVFASDGSGAVPKLVINGATGTFTHTGFTAVTAAAAVVATTTFPLTPLGSYQPVSSNQNNVTTTLALGVVPKGTEILFVNTGSNAWGIANVAGTQAFGSGKQLGISDTLKVLYDGVQWLQVSYSDN